MREVVSGGVLHAVARRLVPPPSPGGGGHCWGGGAAPRWAAAATTPAPGPACPNQHRRWERRVGWRRDRGSTTRIRWVDARLATTGGAGRTLSSARVRGGAENRRNGKGGAVGVGRRNCGPRLTVDARSLSRHVFPPRSALTLALAWRSPAPPALPPYLARSWTK